ncbi:WD repeat-containing protein 64-like isoform X2 [Mytilus edulis]|uniref:WD repeat-containing protein 64-like isoform X2 n=1 Tax=Mytilus edulis TaxID=6550 RepID=UPI0039F0A0FA
MSEGPELRGEGLGRPYTSGTFQSKLDQFAEFINSVTFQDVEATPEERRQMITESLRFDQFCDRIRQLFGSDIKNTDLKAIYRKISTNPDAKVDWSELFGYFQSNNDDEEIVVGEEVNVFTVSKRRRVGEAAGDKTRRDTVQCLRYIPSQDGYISASQKGAICIWNNKLRLQSCIDINEPAWVTGCEYLPSIRKAICCTERSICVWDNRSKGKNQHVFVIKPFENSPQCISYVPNPEGTLDDIVLFGDDMGYLNVLKLVAKDLTPKNSKDSDKRQTQIPTNITIAPDQLTHKIVRRKLHNDYVLQVKYFPELRCFASCSPHSKKSFVLEEVDRLYDDGEVRDVAIPKGVNCFEYCTKANIIATGGVDKVIRVWHPHIFSRPTGKLLGHLFTIVDICCNEKDQHLISLSTARVFRVWDIHTLTCLQVFTDNEERPGEKRIYSMIFDNKHERLLTGSSVIDSWPLTRAVQDTMQVPHTHDRPVSQILYNRELGQIVTICTESVIKVWEYESGKRVYTITDAHGPNVEVTACCLDSSGYRLATGGFDGSIKVWDFGSGQELKHKSGRQSDEDLSIVGMKYWSLDKDRVILTAGWNNKIRVILDNNESYDLPSVREFSDVYFFTKDIDVSASLSDPFTADPLPDIGQNSNVSKSSKKNSIMSNNVFKKDYLLTLNEMSTIETFSQNTLYTGCSNGKLITWNIEKSSVDKVHEIQDPEETSSPPTSRHRSRQGGEKKINQIKFLIHQEKKLSPEYLKKTKVEDETEREGAGSQMSHRSKTSRIGSRLGSRVGSRLSHHSNAPPKPPDKIEQKEQKDFVDQLTARIEGEDPEKEGKEEEKDKDEEEKKDYEKPDIELNLHEDEEEEEEEEWTEERKWVEETYDPIIVTAHQDSYIRFWNMEGQVLREVSAVTRRQGTPVTALCHDERCNILISGDSKGYLTLWSIGKFLRDPQSNDPSAIKQVISWRAHLVKVVSLVYINSLKCILSGSTDGSVRVWWGYKGRFVGFYGQHRPFVFPEREETAGPPTLPYDITEGPLAPVQEKSAKQTIRTVQKYEYPLIFDNEKWTPFRRSAYIRQSEAPPPKKKPFTYEIDKKFFGALIKPKDNLNRFLELHKKAYNHHLESIITGDKNQGAVFRALPVYRVKTPKKIKEPELGFKLPHNNEASSIMFGGASKSLPSNSQFRDQFSMDQKQFLRIRKPSQVNVLPRINSLYLKLNKKYDKLDYLKTKVKR